MQPITLNSIQDIRSHSLDEIKASSKITIGDNQYTVQITNNVDISVSRDLSNVTFRSMNAIKDFFLRMLTSGESATETRANQLKEIIQSKNPIKLDNITSRIAEKGISHHEGTNRDVYIVESEGRGYKISKNDSSWVGNKFEDNPDLRLNDIYKSENFYDGKYAKLATHKTVQISGVNVPVFDLIPGSEPLGDEEKIPFTVLKMMEDSGFRPFDVKPQNFVKLKNESGGYDYIPIDAKQIGEDISRSFRSDQVYVLQGAYGDYAYEGGYVDKNA